MLILRLGNVTSIVSSASCWFNFSCFNNACFLLIHFEWFVLIHLLTIGGFSSLGKSFIFFIRALTEPFYLNI